MRIGKWIAGAAMALAMSVPITASAQSVEEFYSGRDVKIIIGAGLQGCSTALHLVRRGKT